MEARFESEGRHGCPRRRCIKVRVLFSSLTHNLQQVADMIDNKEKEAMGDINGTTVHCTDFQNTRPHEPKPITVYCDISKCDLQVSFAYAKHFVSEDNNQTCMQCNRCVALLRQ